MVQRRTMSHTDMGIVGATTDTFILFENGVRRNRLVLPGLSNAAVQARPARIPSFFKQFADRTESSRSCTSHENAAGPPSRPESPQFFIE